MNNYGASSTFFRQLINGTLSFHLNFYSTGWLFAFMTLGITTQH